MLSEMSSTPGSVEVQGLSCEYGIKIEDGLVSAKRSTPHLSRQETCENESKMKYSRATRMALLLTNVDVE